MKKKFLATLSLALILCMSMVVMAANSSTASSATTTSPTGEITAYTAPATAAYSATVGKTTTASGTALSVAAASQTAVDTMYNKTKSISPFAYALSTAEYSGSLKSGGENVALSCAGIRANDTVDTIVVLHYSATKGMEVLKPAAVSAGQVTVYLSDLSPISIIHIPAGTAVSYTNSAVSSKGTAATSPQTGEE